MSHHHHSHHHPHPTETSETRLIWSILLNLIITVAEIIGGIVSGSLALLSDAVHNLSDTASLGVSLFAAKISKRSADADKTFGYHRAEIIGAFANLIVLILIAGWLIVESVQRFLNPSPVDAPVMLGVASIGLLANILTAALLWRDSQHSLNIRSAYLHIVTDALSSVGVIVGGLLIWRFDWFIVDPILCAVISAYILYHSGLMLTETVNILMDSSPDDVDIEMIRQDVISIDGVSDMHHIHLWRRTESMTAMEAHVLVQSVSIERMEDIKREIKSVLLTKYNLAHSTLEMEFTPCDEPENDDCYEKDTTERMSEGGEF
ncbi:MAG: cation transporter [Rhodothermales bacterium]|nr:cation transporter [Rhodothermales bacterium]